MIPPLPPPSCPPPSPEPDDAPTRTPPSDLTELIFPPEDPPGFLTWCADPGHLIGGRYELVVLIAEGGMGAVWKALDTRTNLVVAVKLILRRRYRFTDLILRLFCREARILRRLKKLRHPHIVQILDFFPGSSASPPAIILEWIDGWPLSARLGTNAPLERERVHALIWQIGMALQAMHQLGIIHRDVSGRNIMETLDESGRPVLKLIDTGLSRDTHNPESVTVAPDGVAIGTLKWAAWEVHGGERPSEASDLYSFALLVAQCLTGMTTEALRMWGIHRNPEIIPGLSAEESHALGAALAYDPKARPTSVGEFVRAMISAPMPSPPKVMKTRQWLKAAGTLLMSLVSDRRR